MDQARNGWAEGLLLVAADPDEIPIRALETCGQCSAQASTSANSNATLVQCGRIGYAGELELTRPDMGGRIVDETTCEVALYTTDEVVIFRVSAL